MRLTTYAGRLITWHYVSFVFQRSSRRSTKGVREKVVSRSDYATIKARLLEDVRDVELINLTDEVVTHSMIILEQHPVRAMDALHIASAQAWKADLFVSADQDQMRAVHRLGLAHRLI